MTRNTLNSAIAAALLGAMALVGCNKKADDVPAPTPAETAPVTPSTPPPADNAPPATAPTASVGSVDVGNAIGDDNKLTVAMDTFSPKDTVYASVSTTTSDPAAKVPSKLSARWTFNDGQVVNEESRDLDLSGDGATSFKVSKPDGWPKGKYKVEIMLDGEAAGSKDFEVK